MTRYQKIKGTQDFFELEIAKMRYVENKMRTTVEKAGFFEFRTPVFEYTEVFLRSVGEESDIVSKEMYSFNDKGGRNITLRPEGTASLVRAYVENKMYAQAGIGKFYYVGPMFRYERPQAGRYREFNQFGIEALGQSSPLLDVEVILSAFRIINDLGIKSVKLLINSIGDLASREAYKEALLEYFKPLISSLCSDCQRRYLTNTLRILDCKVDANSDVLKNAPSINKYLNDESKARFASVIASLADLGITYKIDYNLVRGLDYYTDTVFEFVLQNDEGINLALCAGGAYANLVKDLGGPDSPGVGYAFGIERMVKVLEEENLFPDLSKNPDIFIIALDEESKKLSLVIANKLRSANFYVELEYSSTQLKKQFNAADKLKPRFNLIIGENERLSNTVTIKDSISKKQENIKLEKLINWLKENY